MVFSDSESDPDPLFKKRIRDPDTYQNNTDPQQHALVPCEKSIELCTNDFDKKIKTFEQVINKEHSI